MSLQIAIPFRGFSTQVGATDTTDTTDTGVTIKENPINGLYRKEREFAWKTAFHKNFAVDIQTTSGEIKTLPFGKVNIPYKQSFTEFTDPYDNKVYIYYRATPYFIQTITTEQNWTFKVDLVLKLYENTTIIYQETIDYSNFAFYEGFEDFNVSLDRSSLYRKLNFTQVETTQRVNYKLELTWSNLRWQWLNTSSLAIAETGDGIVPNDFPTTSEQPYKVIMGFWGTLLVEY